MRRCQAPIPAKINARQRTLFPAFCGFNQAVGFRAGMSLEDEITRTLPKADVRRVVRTKKFNRRVDAAVELFFPQVKFLCQNRTVDVIVCVVSDDLYDVVSTRVTTPAEDHVEEVRR